MGLISWLADKFGNTKAIPLTGVDLDEYINEYTSLFSEVYIREMAFWSCVNIVANIVSKCEFKTFMGGKEVKKREYYLWNFEPNKNQNSSGFIHKWMAKLYGKNECLIIKSKGKVLVADSYNRKKYALYDDVFTDVTVGDFTFNRTFLQSEVLFFELAGNNMRKVISGLYDSYSKLVTYSMKAYLKSRGTKGVFNYDAIPVAGTKERELFDDLIDNKFKRFLETGDAIIPLGKGQNYEEKGSKTYSNESTRDIRAMIDDICEFTARGFCIPPVLLKGEVQGTKDAMDNLLTVCIDPLVSMLSKEINRKRYGYSGFENGDYLQIDTSKAKHVDLLTVATAIDKLISSGAFSINDVRKLLGQQPIEEDWADQHFITKNYATVEDLLESLGLEGGGRNDSS